MTLAVMVGGAIALLTFTLYWTALIRGKEADERHEEAVRRSRKEQP